MAASLTAAVFSYAGDALPVIECVRHLTRLGVRAWVFDDSKQRLPGWVQGQLWRMGAAYEVTKFPRRGNLNGTECCIGILESMLSTGADVVAKIDADTLLVQPDLFAAGTVGCCSTMTARRDAFGACYSIRRETITAALAILRGMPRDPYCPEDLTIWSAIRATGHPFEMIDHHPDGGGLAAVPIGSPVDRPERFAALTFGNLPKGGWEDRQIQVTLEMRRFASGIDRARESGSLPA
jgi:hypothetical protein